MIGVLGLEGDLTEGFTEGASDRGVETMLVWLPEDCRECVGGVGGKPPILFEACFNVCGLEVSEPLTEGIPVSITRFCGLAAGAEVYR